MRITKIELKDFGPHQKLVFDMDAACVGILGPNGAGKTHCMDAIGFAMTGLFPKGKPSTVFVRNGADNASVKCWFRQNGKQGNIFRQFGKTPKRNLELEGHEKAYTRAEDVNTHMAELLNCDRRALDTAVFLSQGQIGDMLFKLSAEKAERMAQIAGIDHLPQVHAILGTKISSLQAGLVDYTAQRDEAAGAREHALTSLRSAEAELATRQNREVDLAWVDDLIAKASRTLDARQNLDRSQASVLAAETAVKACGAETKEHLAATHSGLSETLAGIETRKTRHKEAQTKLALRKAWQDKLAEAPHTEATVAAALAALEKANKADALADAQLLQAEQAAGRLLAHREARTKLESCAAAALSVQQVLDSLPASMTDNRRAEIEVQADDLKLRIAGLELACHRHAGAEQVCPVCNGRDLSQLPTLEEAAPKLEASRSELERLQTQLRQEAVSQTNKVRLAETLKARQDEMKSASDEVDRLGPFVEDALVLVLPELRTASANARETAKACSSAHRAAEIGAEQRRSIEETLAGMLSTAELQAQVSETSFEDNSEDIRLQLSKVAAKQAALNAAAARKESAEQAHVKAGHDLSESEQALTVAAGRKPETRLGVNWRLDLGTTLEAAETLRRTYRDEQASYNSAKGVAEAHTNTLRRHEKRLLDIETDEQTNARANSVIQELEQMRQAFGPKGIQHNYLTKLFRIVAGATQRELEVWEDDFMVVEDPDNPFSFLFARAHQPDMWMDQIMLSGGQRVRLSLSFAQAMQKVLFPGLNFMSADEPSHHLDPEGIEGLMRMFRSLAADSENDAQVIVVDHKPELAAALGRSLLLTKIPEQET